MLPDNTIWHLGHSSHMMTFDNKVIFFDYAFEPGLIYLGDRSRPEFLTPSNLAASTVRVFISHAHRDHFNPAIFTWRDVIPDIRFFVPDHIPAANDRVMTVEDSGVLSRDGMEIHTLPSSDIGVAFSILIGTTHIYFAGDHAMWEWNGDAGESAYIRAMAAHLDSLPGVTIAFHVCDPRLSGKGAGGIGAFSAAFQPEILVPMHTFGKYRFNQKIRKDLDRRGFKGFFWCIAQAGDLLDYSSLMHR